MRIRVSVILLAGLGVAFGQTRLPEPTGTYPVGRRALLWSDAKRLEDVGPSAGKPREIAASVFYPAAPNGRRVEYYPGLKGLEDAAETRILRRQFGGAWNAVTSGAIQTNSHDAPAMAPGRMQFPVLVFSPGGQAPALAYQIQLEDLASHGYVIFALDHGTDSALMIRPDRSLVSYVNRHPPDPLPTVAYLESVRDEAGRRAADIVFSLDQVTLLASQAGSVFHKRLDLSRVGVFGHSAGGQAAVRACQIDRRIRACLNQDGEMFGVPVGALAPIPTLLPGKPTLAPVAVIHVAEPGPSDAQLAAVKVTREQFESWRSAKNRALRQFLHDNAGESTLITITAPGFVHASFLDIRLLGPDPSRESVANHRTATKITRAYFDACLRRGGPKNGTRIQAEPAAGITVERLDNRP
jgi:hypothetical protein